MCYSPCLIQGTRYPFVPKVLSSANQSRGIRETATQYESLMATNAVIPRPRTVRKQSAAADYPCPRTVHVRALSAPTDAVTNSPQPRTLHSFNSPRTGNGSGHRLSPHSP